MIALVRDTCLTPQQVTDHNTFVAVALIVFVVLGFDVAARLYDEAHKKDKR